MKIAVISMIRDSWGGSEELWYQMAELALADGHEVLHLSYAHPHTHPKMQELESMGLKRFTRPAFRASSKNKLAEFAQLGLNFIRKKFDKSVDKIFEAKPDVILYVTTAYHIASEKSLLKNLDSYTGKFFINVQLNATYWRDVTDSDATVVAAAYKKANKVFFVSNANLKAAERHLCTTISNGEVLRNPVNLTEIKALDFPNTKVWNLAMVGNLSTIHKGQDVMLEVLAADKWKNENWKLNIYGTGNDEQYLKNLVAHYKLNDKVIFHGRVADMQEVWKQNHILLMPSLMEGMPLAVVEAMLCARPALVTDVGGNTDWIDDNVNGYVAAVASVTSLNEAFARAWNDKQNWESVGKKAFEKASQLYDKNAGKTLLDKMMNE